MTAEQQSTRVATGPRGRGVFARRAIAQGEVVERCPTLDVRGEEITGLLRGYVFANPYEEGVLTLMLGFGSLYNHSDSPNVAYAYCGDREVEFRATRPVEAGTELLVSYGATWWSSRGEVPT